MLECTGVEGVGEVMELIWEALDRNKLKNALQDNDVLLIGK